MKSYFKVYDNFLSFITERKVGLYRVKDCDTRIIQQILLSITVTSGKCTCCWHVSWWTHFTTSYVSLNPNEQLNTQESKTRTYATIHSVFMGIHQLIAQFKHKAADNANCCCVWQWVCGQCINISCRRVPTYWSQTWKQTDLAFTTELFKQNTGTLFYWALPPDEMGVHKDLGCKQNIMQ
jgi:hypothetical protein